MRTICVIFCFLFLPLFGREANTTLNFPAELTSSLQFEDFLGGLTFSNPVCLRTPPGENSLYVVEKPGRVYLIEDVNNPQKQLFLDISSKVLDGGEQGLLSIAFHPEFSTNKTLYLFYSANHNSTRHQFISKFVIQSESSNLNTPYSFTETVMIRQLDQAGNHNGGDMHFGQDGYLYISLGDEGGQNDARNNSQLIDKDYFSAIMRIDVDRKAENIEPNNHPAVLKPGGQAHYKVPADNPWVGATSFNGNAVNPSNVRTEFYAVGFRNPWRMSFDPDGNLWIGDVGQGLREEIDIIPNGQAGMNFGWAFREGFIAGPKSAPAGVTADDPIYDYIRTGTFGGRSVTGGVVYTGNQIPSLKDKYIFGDYASGNIWHLTKVGNGAQVDFITNEINISAFGHDPETGEVLACKYNSGKILKLVEGTANEGDIPQTLSATGAFSNLNNLTPETGVEAYEPNVTFWSDYAIKSRWFSLPNLSQTFGFKAEGPWTYPAGTVWVKHFDLEMVRGNPSSAVRVETRFLVKTESGAYGLSYRWNSAGTEATLVPSDGESINYNIEIGGVSTPKTWTIPSRSSCKECHTPNGGFALSFNTRQLNKTAQIFGSNQNQLTALFNEGYLDVNPGNPANLNRHYAQDDPSASLEQKARSYLDVNCAYCHQDGGTTPAEFDARALLTNLQTGLINGVPLNDGGDSTRRLILPGHPEKSVVLSRISASDGFTRMPPIATTELDHEGMDLIQHWIEDLGAPPVGPKDPFQPDENGMLVIEAENHDGVTSGNFGHEWIQVNESGASGGFAFNAAPDSGRNQNTGYVVNSPRLDYKVNFDRTGTYFVWVRGHAIAGLRGTSDSIHIGLNGEAIASSDRITGFTAGYDWTNSTMDGVGATIEVTELGEHTINAWMREDGFTFDKLILTPVETFIPSENGPAESLRAASNAARKVTVSIDPYHPNNWDFFQARVINESSSASIESVKITAIGNGPFDLFENGSNWTVTPNLGGNNDGVENAEVTLTFAGSGLGPGESDENGINNNGSDIDGANTGYDVVVRFTDGRELSGSMTNIGDSDDGDPEFWQVILESSNSPEDIFYASYNTVDFGNSSFSMTEQNKEFTMTAAGADIWRRSDEFGFAYMEWDGDVTLVAKVNSLQHVHDWSKTGVMIRSSLNANASHASMFATHNRVSLHSRTADGETTSARNIGNEETKPPVWLKIQREGNIFRAYYSFDGGTWHPNGQRTIVMPEKVFIGIALTSHVVGTTSTASISNVEVRKPEDEIFVRRLVLTNADTGVNIQNLQDRAVINRSSLGVNNFNIRAELNEVPGSVEFKLNDILRRYENLSPFYFDGDDGSWSPAPGDYSIEVTPSSQSQGAGVRGETLKVRITIE